MATGDREDAIIIKADGLKLPSKPQNQPMKTRIIEASERIIARNPEQPPPEPEPPPTPTVTAIAIGPTSMKLKPGDTVALATVATLSDGTSKVVTSEAQYTVTPGGGVVSASGVYTAGTTIGDHIISASYSGKSATAAVVIAAPAPANILFMDKFDNGMTAPEQNGIRWTNFSVGSGDQIIKAPGALIHRFKGSGALLTDDSWCESNLKIGDRKRLFVSCLWETGPEYLHRNAEGPDNNKVLRLFGGPLGSTRDQAYQGKLSVGMSVNPSGSFESFLIAEFKKPTGMGPYGEGPNVLLFRKGINRRRLSFFADVGTADLSNPDAPIYTGIMQIWLDGQMIYDQRDQPLFTPGEHNHFQYMYLPGWSNSGFNVDTDLKLLEIVIADLPVPDYT